MAWQIALNFQDGGGDRDITEYVLQGSFRREWRWANGLTPASSQLRFAIQNNATIANLFLAATSTEVLVTVAKNGNGYFRGIVQNKFDVAVSTRLAPVEVMCVDRGELLRRKITSTFAWAGYEVCTPSATSTSIVHQLLALAGFASTDWDISETISAEIAYFVVVASDDKTYWDLLAELLGEFGYAFWFDDDGDFKLAELAPESVTSEQTFDETIVSGTLAASKRQRSYEAVEVEWATLLGLANQVVFSDTTGGTAHHKAYIPVAAGDWYPENVETYDVFSEYRIDGREVVYCASPSIDWSGETGLSLATFTNYYRRALIKIQNTAGYEKHITKLDVVGSVVVRGDPSFTRVEFVTNSEKIEKITARWITTQAQATFLASMRSRFYEHGHIEYRWQSRTLVTPGAIVTLQDPILGMNNVVRVQSRSDNEVTGIATYTGYGIVAYTAETPETSGVHTVPGARTVDGRVDELPTFDDIEDGWDASAGSGTNGTTTPTVPTVTAHGLYKAIVVLWDRQTYLTNFARYEVQVSDDGGTTWYSLDFGGAGVGTATADTDCPVERLTHTRIPFGGTEGAPTGTTYHYRVRRVTRAEAASSWSTPVSATTLTIDTGDLAENSITANKVSAGVINALIAEIQSYLTISDTLGWLAGQYTTPVSGNQRAYLDKNEIRLQIHNGSSWVDRFVVSASDGTDNYTARLSSTLLGLNCAPECALDVYGQVRIRDTGSAGYALLVIGDDAYLSDEDTANTLGVRGVQDTSKGNLQLGTALIYSVSGRLAIGNATPSSYAKLSILNYSAAEAHATAIAFGDDASTRGAALALPSGGYSSGYRLRLFESYGWNFTLQSLSSTDGPAAFRIQPEESTTYTSFSYFKLAAFYGSAKRWGNLILCAEPNSNYYGFITSGANQRALHASCNAYYAGNWYPVTAGYGTVVWIGTDVGSTNQLFAVAHDRTSTSVGTAFSSMVNYLSLTYDGTNSRLKLGGAASGTNHNVYIDFSSLGYLLWDNGAGSLKIYVNGGLIANWVSSGLYITNSSGTAVAQFRASGNIFLNGLSGNGTDPYARVSTSTGQVRYDSSSLRYKKDVRSLSAAEMQILPRLRPIVFRAKETDDRPDMDIFGFAAEEVLLLAECLGGRKMVDGNLVPEYVNYEKVTPLLVGGWQDHEARIKALESLAAKATARERGNEA